MPKPIATNKLLRIGEVAARTGLSAKALRLYEARGLLLPDAHSDGGYRLYGAKSLSRLAEIGVLRRAGFTLSEIGTLLERCGSAASLVEARIASLRHEVAARSVALVALEHAWRRLDLASKPDVEQLLEGIRMSEQLDVRFSEAQKAEFKRRGEILGRHFTPEERERLRRRAEQYGSENMQRYGQAWQRLIAQVRAAMDGGMPATDSTVIEMARRWHALVDDFTGGDDRIARKMRDAYDAESQAMAAQGMDPAMFVYVGEAMRAAGLTFGR